MALLPLVRIVGPSQARGNVTWVINMVISIFFSTRHTFTYSKDSCGTGALVKRGRSVEKLLADD